MSILQKVIRDADMMHLLEDDYIQQVMIGLSTELNMTFKEFIPIQLNLAVTV